MVGLHHPDRLIEGVGDLDTCSSEYFNVYVENNQLNGNYCPGYQDCTYRQVGSNIGVTSYISGKSSFKIQGTATNEVNMFACGSTYGAKIRWTLQLW